MFEDKQKALLFGAAVAVRLLLFTAFPSLPTLLAGRVEVSTPVSSFKRLLEGVFLYTHDVSPYDGGVFHQAPLLLPLFSLLPNPAAYPFATNLLFTIVDVLGANALMNLAQTGQSVSSRLFTSPRKELRSSTLAVGAGYLFNPFTIVTCLARSTTAFNNLFVLTAIGEAAHGASTTFLLALAAASYLTLHPILLFPPLVALCYDVAVTSGKQTSSAFTFVAKHVVGLVGIIGALLYASALLTGSWEFLASTYGFRLLLPDLTPNVGLWWYFFIEMFDSFREFFLGVFWLHMASYVPGLMFRMRNQPLFVATALIGIFAIFQPYPSIADSALYFSLLPLYRHVFSLTRYTFLASTGLLYATFLGPAFYHLWIYSGSGNANFFYAITLVWSLGLSVINADIMYAVLRDEWEVERPEMRGKDARQI